MPAHEAPTAAAVNATVARWAAKHPDLTDRLHRAAALVANVTPGRMPHVFFVEGSEGASYIVRVNKGAKTSTCNCPDSTQRGAHCKHRLATALYLAAKES